MSHEFAMEFEEERFVTYEAGERVLAEFLSELSHELGFPSMRIHVYDDKKIRQRFSKRGGKNERTPRKKETLQSAADVDCRFRQKALCRAADVESVRVAALETGAACVDGG